MYNSREKHCPNMMDLLNDIKEIKKTKYCLSSNSEEIERYIKINSAELMRNYQYRKTNNKLT